MLEHMALQEDDDDPITTTNTKKSLYQQSARFISTVLSPAVIALPTILLVALATHAANALLSAAIAIFFLSIGPMIYIGIGVSLGKFTDLDVSVRSQRTGPFLFGLGSCLLGLIVLHLLQAPRALQSLQLLIFISGIILMVITFWWKISMHASSIAASVTLLTIFYGKVILPAFILVGLVGWSRVVLKRHTPGQVIAGSIVGVALTWILATVHGL